MICKYKCYCMEKEAELTVPDRLPDEDIVHWMETAVGFALYTAHRLRSPNCQSTSVQYLKIPHNGDGETPLGTMPKLN